MPPRNQQLIGPRQGGSDQRQSAKEPSARQAGDRARYNEIAQTEERQHPSRGRYSPKYHAGRRALGLTHDLGSEPILVEEKLPCTCQTEPLVS